MKRQDAVRPVDVCHAKSTDPEEKEIFFWLTVRFADWAL